MKSFLKPTRNKKRRLRVKPKQRHTKGPHDRTAKIKANKRARQSRRGNRRTQ